MASITLEQAREHLAFWLIADRNLSRGEVARVADQRLDRANGETVAERIKYWSRKVSDLERIEAGQPATPFVLADFSHRA